jgi:hypothetical protein
LSFRAAHGLPGLWTAIERLSAPASPPVAMPAPDSIPAFQHFALSGPLMCRLIKAALQGVCRGRGLHIFRALQSRAANIRLLPCQMLKNVVKCYQGAK